MITRARRTFPGPQPSVRFAPIGLPQHLEAAEKIAVQAFGDDAHGDVARAWYEAEPGAGTVLLSDGQPVGFIDHVPLTTQGLADFVRTGETAVKPADVDRAHATAVLLAGVAVDPRYRGLGWPARRLADAFLSAARALGTPAAGFWAEAWSPAGCRFLGRLGFAPHPAYADRRIWWTSAPRPAPRPRQGRLAHDQEA